MNKHIIWLFTLLVFVLAGCEKDEIGNTATEALAGEWKVTVDAVDEGGNVIAEDFNGIGHILKRTEVLYRRRCPAGQRPTEILLCYRTADVSGIRIKRSDSGYLDQRSASSPVRQ